MGRHDVMANTAHLTIMGHHFQFKKKSVKVNVSIVLKPVTWFAEPIN